MNLQSLWPLLKPVVKQLFDTVLVPQLKKYEDQIGSEVLKQVLEAVTADLEAQADAFLS